MSNVGRHGQGGSRTQGGRKLNISIMGPGTGSIPKPGFVGVLQILIYTQAVLSRAVPRHQGQPHNEWCTGAGFPRFLANPELADGRTLTGLEDFYAVMKLGGPVTAVERSLG